MVENLPQVLHNTRTPQLHERNMPVRTRTHVSAEAMPPKLRRTSCVCRVRITRRGKARARRVLLPCDEDMEYFFDSIPGETRHHLCTLDGKHHRIFYDVASIPEFAYVTDGSVCD